MHSRAAPAIAMIRRPDSQKIDGARARWCCQTGTNCRPLPYHGSALPLSYGSRRGRTEIRSASAAPCATARPHEASRGHGPAGEYGTPLQTSSPPTNRRLAKIPGTRRTSCTTRPFHVGAVKREGTDSFQEDHCVAGARRCDAILLQIIGERQVPEVCVTNARTCPSRGWERPPGPRFGHEKARWPGAAAGGNLRR